MGPRRIELLPQPCEGCVLATRPWAPTAKSVDTLRDIKSRVLTSFAMKYNLVNLFCL